MKQAVIYARVSTERQEEQKTIESQINALREICKKDGAKIVKEYIDDGWSGGTLDRPALDKLRDDARQGLFDTVYFYSPDRLARDSIDQGIVERELMKRGIEIIYHDKPLTDDNRLEVRMKALFAEHERRLILERTRRGRLYRAKEGKIISSIAPYGYYKEDHQLKINKEEAKIVNLIFDLYLKYGSKREVRRELEARNIPTRHQESKWRHSTVDRILRNKAYLGEYYYNRRKRVESESSQKRYKRIIKDKLIWREENEWIEIKIPAIISKEKFNEVQELLDRKSNRYFRKSQYLLSGLITCGLCGATYSGERCKGTRYYRCSDRHRDKPKNCPAKMVRADEIESKVWNTIKKGLEQPQVLLKRLLMLNKDSERDLKLLKEEKSDLLRETEKIDRKRKKLLDLYAETDKSSKEVILKELEDYSQKEKNIKMRLEGIEAKLTQIANKPTFIKKINRLFQQLNKVQLKDLKFEQKQRFLKYLIEKVIYWSDSNKIVIIGRVPLVKEEKIDFNLEKAILVGTKALIP